MIKSLENKARTKISKKYNQNKIKLLGKISNFD